MEAGNILGKCLQYFAGKKLAHVALGAKAPILIPSRTASTLARLTSIAMAALTCSFTYVSDTVAGMYASIAKPEANGEIFNIGSTHEINILELAKEIKRLSKTAGELKQKPYWH